MRSTLPSPEVLLKRGLSELSLAHTGEQVKAFVTYLSELKKWNKAYSLTSLKTDEDIVIKHFLDSLLYLAAIPEGELNVMDIGSGAGFPGVPIKIIRPEITMHLVEPTRKKAAFLRHLIGVLGLRGIEVIEGRIEEIKDSAFDVAVTRALFDVKDFCRKALPLLKEGGRLVVSKGPRVNEELKAIRGIHHEVVVLPLPLSALKRFIVVISKGVQETGTAGSGPPVTRGDTQARRGDSCINTECRLRKAGCMGFEGCPGFKSGA
jgi:16S rRNA (guanine527-N7)-methyltransferase